MAKKIEIESRRSILKKYMFENRDIFFTFKEIREFYHQPNFVDKYGYLSDSRIRSDLNAIGIRPTKDNQYSFDSNYEIDDLEYSISEKLDFFDLYKPTLLYQNIDFNFDDYGIGNDLNLYSIILKHNPSKTKSNSKLYIDKLISDLNKFFELLNYINNTWYFDIIKGSQSIQFLFNNIEDAHYFYYMLVKWKKPSVMFIRKD